MTNNEKNERLIFENAIRSLEAEIANAGLHLTVDSTTRLAYTREIRTMADQMRLEVARGRITWAQAAKQAQETRNLIMEMMRWRSTSIGRAIAEKLKREGKTLNELVARKTLQLHGQNTQFNSLSTTQQNAVYAEIVKSAGQSNHHITIAMRHLSHAGRSLIALSIALSVYSIATAENKTSAAGREITITGAGIGGGIAGGAIAGLACGPGAPVCVSMGAFVGGTLAAFGVSFFW